MEVKFDIAIFLCLLSIFILAGVQIVDICIATRSHNGGLIDLLDLRKLLCQKRKATLESLSEDDCLRAISKLKVRLLSFSDPSMFYILKLWNWMYIVSTSLHFS